LQKRYVVAARPDGSEGRYRTYPQMTPPLAVDCDRALGAIHLLGTFNPRYLWTIRFFRALAVLELVAGAYTVRWLPVATVIWAGLAYAIHRALPWAAADFARETVSRHPEVRTRFVLAGIILADMPRVAPTTPAEWAVSAWGSARAPHDDPRG